MSETSECDKLIAAGNHGPVILEKESSVLIKVSRRAAGIGPADRKTCLRCRKQFRPTGSTNWMCRPCQWYAAECVDIEVKVRADGPGGFTE
jgi:hypothetical protein